MSLRGIFLIVGLLFSFTIAFATVNTSEQHSTVIANASASPLKLLQTVTTQLLTTLQAKRSDLKNNPDHIYDIVDRILVPHIDAIGMARSVVDRSTWIKANHQERIAFSKAFLKVVIRTYASALNAYTDQRIEYDPIRGGITNHSRIYITTRIIRSNGPPVEVVYRTAKVNKQWKVYDMVVEGVSLLQSFRAQITNKLSQGISLTQLTKQLKQHNQLS